jgi:hypothetical protein
VRLPTFLNAFLTALNQQRTSAFPAKCGHVLADSRGRSNIGDRLAEATRLQLYVRSMIDRDERTYSMVQPKGSNGRALEGPHEGAIDWRIVALRAVVFIEAMWALLLAELVLSLGFGKVWAVARAWPVLPVLRPTERRAREICWAVNEATLWYFKRVECLQRSLVGTVLLRTHGIDAELVIGHRQAPFQSHAWIEVGAQIVNDRPQYCRLFTPIERIRPQQPAILRPRS